MNLVNRVNYLKFFHNNIYMYLKNSMYAYLVGICIYSVNNSMSLESLS